ncbi:VOC family protein [Alkalibacter rhizosphaerae]|uniref:VOC family protein n=1 Tax=Alkalibacter rhizosphaerae TaxID=2815577 RepID=A0A974XGN5_9FIRM|nr:VOC family protein [Alkalibacter rhizosphaerae]QSX09351.1 VOC family protein [Alkalibacter rhizosphaerae]
MSFLWYTFKVVNMEKSVKFYTDIVGLKEQRRFNPSPTTEIVFLGDEEGTKVELIFDRTNKARLEYPDHMSMGFSIDDIEEKIKEVSQKGYAVHSGPIKPNANTEFFFVLDPNGMKVQFVKEG